MLSVLSESCGITEKFFPALFWSCNHCLLFSLAFPCSSTLLHCFDSLILDRYVHWAFQADTAVKSGFGILKFPFAEQELKQKQPKPHSLAVVELDILFPLSSLVLRAVEQAHGGSFRLCRSATR